MFCCSQKKHINPKKITVNSDELQPISILKNNKNNEMNTFSKKRRKSIHPNYQEPINIPNSINSKKKNKSELEKNKKQRDDFTKIFLQERIPCGGCNEIFSLEDRKLAINCGSCNHFFHCNIAGRCVGDDCKIETDQCTARLGYCRECVNLDLDINYKNSNECICKDCESKKKNKKYCKSI